MYIGLDLGTSGIRAVLMDDAQAIIASTEATYDVDRPHLGWSEQNPLDWIEGCKKVLRGLAPLARIIRSRNLPTPRCPAQYTPRTALYHSIVRMGLS